MSEDKIFSSLKILGMTHEVRKRPGMYSEAKEYGSIGYAKQIISVDTEVHKDQIGLTIIHEAFHAYLHTTATDNDMDHDKMEKMCNQVAHFVNDLIVNNPDYIQDLTRFLKGEVKVD